MKKLALLSTIASILFFASCKKDIHVDVPPYQSKLTVFSSSAIGEPIMINVGKSLGIAERRNMPDLTITNATVNLYEDGALKESLVYKEDMKGYLSTLVAQAGKTYSVKVSAPFYTDAASSSAVPSAVPITGLTRVPNARSNENGDPQDELLFTFNDPSTAGDYYIIRITTPKDSFTYNNFCVNSGDASIETPYNENVDLTTCLDNNSIFMRDELFNGKQKQVKIYVNSDNLHYTINGPDTTFPYIELLHVPEAYFKFEKSRQAAESANGDPFSEPVNVYTNVTNGYGVFSIISSGGSFIR